MGIRFSMKWLLAGMVYVALAAAALTRPHWGWADVLWALSFIAVCYAATLAFNFTGERRSRAVGFLIGSLLYAGALHLSEDVGPLARLVIASAPATNAALPAYMASPRRASATTGIPGWSATMSPQISAPATPYQSFIAVSPLAAPNYGLQIRTANAVGVMLAGLIGSILSALTYRKSQARSHAA